MKILKGCDFVGLFLAIAVMDLTGSSTAHSRDHAKAGHKAHVHGSALLNLAIESGVDGEVEFHVPGESVFGFERAAKTKKEIDKQNAALKILREDFGKILQFPVDAKCALKNNDVKIEGSQKGHNEVDADYTFKCSKPLAGLKVTFDATELFPHIKEVSVQVIGPRSSQATKLRNGRGEFVIGAGL